MWIGAWRKETGITLPVLLDPDRVSYAAYGLERSLWRAWSPRNLAYYARAVWRGERLQPYRGDTQQLGGDFIVDNSGTLRYVYPSQDPTDRPPVADLLSALAALK